MTDKERFDWLENNFPSRVGIGKTDNSGWCVFDDYGDILSNGTSLRDAIDKAREKVELAYGHMLAICAVKEDKDEL